VLTLWSTLGILSSLLDQCHPSTYWWFSATILLSIIPIPACNSFLLLEKT